MQEHAEPVQAALRRLDSDKQKILVSWNALIVGNGALMFLLNLLASGSVSPPRGAATP